jgi:uncharacterized protein YdgA (DUF945 family)
MKKIIIGIVILIVIAGVGVPFVSGLVMEKTVKQSFSNLNTIYSDSGTDVSIEIIKYDRNFASTDIEWKMKLGALSAIYGIEEIIFIDRATHGYTGFVSKTSLEKNKWFTDFVTNQLNGKNPVAITTEYSFSGQITSTIGMDAFSLSVEDEVVEIKEGKALFICDKDMEKFSSEVSWAGVSVSENLQIDGISITSDVRKISTYLWDGTLSFAVDKGKLEEGLQPFELVNFKIDYSLDVDEEEKKLSIVTVLSTAHLQAGPEQIDNAFIRVGVVNIDIPGFEEFMKLYAEMRHSYLKDIAAAGDDPEKLEKIFGKEEVARNRSLIMTACEKFLKKGLEFQISDMYAKFPTGEVKGDAVLSLNEDMTFAQLIRIIQEPYMVMEVLSLQSNFSLPAELVGDNPMLLFPMTPEMPTGLFVKNGEIFTHKMETHAGKLYLNDWKVRL